jgi:hypothetical protein
MINRAFCSIADQRSPEDIEVRRKPALMASISRAWPISSGYALSRQHLFVGGMREQSAGWMLTAIGCMIAASYPAQNGGK